MEAGKSKKQTEGIDQSAVERFVSDMTLGNVFACAYNAAVNYGSERGNKKMWHLIEALNDYRREEGRNKLQALVDAGVIESFNPCSDECCIKPGGLFHVSGCENDNNHPVYRARTEVAQKKIPEGWHAASVTLVGR